MCIPIPMRVKWDMSAPPANITRGPPGLSPRLQAAGIIGVLTVAKPTVSLLPFLELTQRNIARAGLALLAVALLLGWLFSY